MDGNGCIFILIQLARNIDAGWPVTWLSDLKLLTGVFDKVRKGRDGMEWL